MLTISIATCNTNLEKFCKCIDSIIKFTPELTNLVIIDNNSSEENLIAMNNHIAQYSLNANILIHQNLNNEGFGLAHNKGFTFCNTEYFAVLNDDIEFFEVWSTPMIEKLKDDSIAQVGMKTEVCNALSLTGKGFAASQEEIEFPEYVEGSCFMMKSITILNCIDKYGFFFDPSYVISYYEDTDLSLRLRKMGYKLDSVQIDWKHYRATTAKKSQLDLVGIELCNQYRFKRKWNGYLVAKKFGIPVVVKREGAYGDVFLVDPILQAIKQKYEDCAIFLMSKVPDTLINSTYVDGLVDMHRHVPCELFIDLDYAYEKDFTTHIVDAYAKEANVEVNRKTGSVYATLEDHSVVEKFCKINNFITLDISSTWKGKEWSIENYSKLCEMLKSSGEVVVAIGLRSKFNDSINPSFNYVNQLTPIQTAVLMSKAKFHIGHEGLLSHFAQALNLPHLILYGCTSPEYVSDMGLSSWNGIVTPLLCKGCRHRYAAGTSINYCVRNHHCMEAILPDQVYETYKGIYV